MSKRRSAFTLVEMLVVITIIGMLMALLLPAINNAREAAKQIQCTSHQRNVATAFATFNGSKNRLPPSLSLPPLTPDPWIVGGGSYDENLIWGWVPPVLPEMGQQQTYDLMTDTLKQVYSGGSTVANYASIFGNLYIQELDCPSTPRETLDQPWLGYYVNGGRANRADTPYGYGGAQADILHPDWKENGAFLVRIPAVLPPTKKIINEQANTVDEINRGDGASMTLMLVENVNPRWTLPTETLGNTWSNTYIDASQNLVIERPEEHHAAVFWQAGTGPGIPDEFSSHLVGVNEHKDELLDPEHARPSSHHPGVIIVTYCDGHQDKISETIDYGVYCAIMSVRGKDVKQPGSKPPVNDAPWQANFRVSASDLEP